MPEKPSKTPHLHVRSVEGSLFPEAVAITGNARALLQLRAQIDRALTNPDAVFPFDEEVYHDVHNQPFEVAVKRARSPEEMREPVPMPEKTPERLPWARLARGAVQVVKEETHGHERDHRVLGPGDGPF